MVYTRDDLALIQELLLEKRERLNMAKLKGVINPYMAREEKDVERALIITKELLK